MKKTMFLLNIFVILSLSIALIQAQPAFANSAPAPAPAKQAVPGGPATPVVSRASSVAESPALRDIKIEPSTQKLAPREEPNRPIPRPGMSTRPADPSTVFEAPLDMPNVPAPSAVQPVRAFDGLTNLDNVATWGGMVAPPDTDGAVGPNHYIQMANLVWAVYDKDTGAILGGPYPNNALWDAANTGDACELTNDGDPVVLYDQLADRWLISQFALPNYPNGPFYECIAVSKTADPLGAWWLYTFNISATKMDDYPKIGIWPDGYYMSVNQFGDDPVACTATGWCGAGAVAFERAVMLAGGAAQMVYFDMFGTDPNLGGFLPSNLQGMTTPPAGTPNYFTLADDDAWGYSPDQLQVWGFHVDWVTPALSTFTSAATLATDPFDTNMCGYNRDCIPQPGTTQKVDVVGDRLMMHLNYRVFGTHTSMVVNQTVDMGGDHAGVRWYELRDTGAGWSIYQQGDYSPDSDNRWMGSASMDSVGNIALGYSISSSTTYPSVGFTGRLKGDPLGTMTLGENILVAGGGSQLGVNRWGDYSSMLVDPVDNCTFWYTQEYIKDTGAWNWATFIGSFKLAGCGVTWGTLSGNVDDGASPVAGALVTVTGGASTLTDASGNYSFAGLPAGSYDMTVTKYGFNSGSALGKTIADGLPTTQDFTVTAKSMSTVSGTVTSAEDGRPLVATIYIPEYPGSPITADATGNYSVSLEYGTAHNFTVVQTGYLDGTVTLTPATPTFTQDFALALDVAACNASGYAFVSGMSQNFNGATFPSGWTVVDNESSGVAWDLSSNWLDDNYTGGDGDAADANSDAFGPAEFDTELISPVITTASMPGTFLTYISNYQNYAGLDYLDVDIKVDGGAWTNLLAWNEDHGSLYNTPGEAVAVNLSTAVAGSTNFQLRWHYYDPNAGDWDWYAQVDNIKVGDCLPIVYKLFLPLIMR